MHAGQGRSRRLRRSRAVAVAAAVAVAVAVVAPASGAAAGSGVLIDETFGAQTSPANFGLTNGTGTHPNIAAITTYYVPVLTAAMTRP